LRSDDTLEIERLAGEVRRGDPRALARAITLVESESDAGRRLIGRLYSDRRRARVVGITGPPGAGKSTLVDGLVRHTRGLGHAVGVLAVDPTSVFTGGAILGDRIRMAAHAGDDGVFIRSMATRGELGGLSRATDDAATVLGAAGKDVVFIETVGVGQDEVDIAGVADLSLLVLVPGAGDDVQAIKAGIMEIADIFIVNKADREGADRLVQSIEMNLSLQMFGEHDWRPPVVKTVATAGEGIAPVWEAVLAFAAHGGSAAARRRRGTESRLRRTLAAALMRRVEGTLPPHTFETVVERVAAGETDPYSAADALLLQVLG
jgi:LAO/AO transport system kinase